jgi:uncharacterized protein YjbJ (UPF0337 family)
MGDRIDEAKGNIKEGVGKLTRNEDLEAEGAVESEGARAKRNVKGVGNQVAGSVKSTAGELKGDARLRAEGEADRLKGDTQRTG